MILVTIHTPFKVHMITAFNGGLFSVFKACLLACMGVWTDMQTHSFGLTNFSKPGSEHVLGSKKICSMIYKGGEEH